MTSGSAWVSARREFEGVYTNLALARRNWQLLAFGLLGVVVAETVAYIRLSLAPRVMPYVIEVDKFGAARAFGPPDALRRTDTRLVIAQLAEFVRDVRTVVPSDVAEADVMARAYAYVDQRAAEFLNGYFTDVRNNPRVLARTMTRTVEVMAVLPVSRSGGWRVQWTETETPLDGGVTAAVAQPWEAYLTVRVSPPATVEAVERNPLGVYVTSITWTRVGAGGG